MLILKYVLVAIFVSFRSFTAEEHVGMTFENIKGCVFNTVKFAEGTRCSDFRRDFGFVSFEIADYYLYKTGLRKSSAKRIIKKYAEEE